MSKPALSKIEPGTLLADGAYESLVQAILGNELEPGASLSVPELARQLEISRSPVREAVQRLINDGLAVSLPRRGAVVSEIHPEDFDDLFEVREPLEGLAARRAAAVITDRDLMQLDTILANHEKILTSGDPAIQIRLDMTYHATIREVAGNPDLSSLLNRIQMRSHLALVTLWQGETSSRLSLDEHHVIQSALHDRDPDAAEQAARRHICRVRKRVAEAAAADGVERTSHAS